MLTFENVLLRGAEDGFAELLKSDRIARVDHTPYLSLLRQHLVGLRPFPVYVSEHAES